VKGLAHWLSIRPQNCVTVLDTHDGIGVIDVGTDAQGKPGLLPPGDIDSLVETVHARSNGQSRKATGAAANNLDLYQVNCTFYDALGRRDNEYLIARAIQFFVPGIPQVYYVGLFAGMNDMDLLARSGVGRDINRHYFTPAEITSSLSQPVVQQLTHLIRLRNSHPAFAGTAQFEMRDARRLFINWKHGEHWARLDADLAEMRACVTYSPALSLEKNGEWDSQVGTIPSEATR
jgi:sucrose phosphorylase